MDTASNTVFRSGSTTFFLSSRFFPEGIRREVTSFYAFVRTADDFVDTVPPKTREFSAFKRAFLRARGGTPSGNPLIDSMVELEKRRRFPPDYMNAFFRSMEMDLSRNRYRTLRDTQRYMYGSAGVIGLGMSRILGLPAESARFALAMANAFQYINFIRDISEDNTLERTYFPSVHLAKFGLPDLSKDSAETYPEAFAAFMRYEIGFFRSWLSTGLEGLAFIPKRFRIAIRTAADMYAWTADSIFRDPGIVYRRKVKPGKSRILRQGIINTVRILMSPDA